MFTKDYRKCSVFVAVSVQLNLSEAKSVFPFLQREGATSVLAIYQLLHLPEWLVHRKGCCVSVNACGSHIIGCLLANEKMYCSRIVVFRRLPILSL